MGAEFRAELCISFRKCRRRRGRRCHEQIKTASSFARTGRVSPPSTAISLGHAITEGKLFREGRQAFSVWSLAGFPAGGRAKVGQKVSGKIHARQDSWVRDFRGPKRTPSRKSNQITCMLGTRFWLSRVVPSPIRSSVACKEMLPCRDVSKRRPGPVCLASRVSPSTKASSLRK